MRPTRGMATPRGTDVACSLLLMGALALTDVARGGIPVTITNDDTETVLATITDTNVNPAATMASAQPINGFASISVDVPADASGNAHLSWSVSTTDAFEHRCGSGSVIIKPGETLHVKADGECRGH